MTTPPLPSRADAAVTAPAPRVTPPEPLAVPLLIVVYALLTMLTGMGRRER